MDLSSSFAEKEVCSNSYVMAVLSLTAKCKIIINCFNDDCAVSIRFVLFTFILNASLPCSLICNATGSQGRYDYRVLSKSLDSNRSKIYPEMLSTASIKILQHNRHQNLQNKYWNPELTTLSILMYTVHSRRFFTVKKTKNQNLLSSLQFWYNAVTFCLFGTDCLQQQGGRAGLVAWKCCNFPVLCRSRLLGRMTEASLTSHRLR